MPVELLTISSQVPEKSALQYAGDMIIGGRVVAVPTDTFYALSADPFNLAAIEAVFRIKGRPESRALPILVDSIERAISLIRDVPDNFLRLSQQFWPGPLTLVIEATDRLPLKVTGNSGRVALRWANSRIVSGLIASVGGPITGTSANISGFPSCTNAQQIMKQLGDRLPLVLDAGDTGGILASTIVALRGDEWAIVRDGAIPEDDIRKALDS